jgi:hypothetical protein
MQEPMCMRIFLCIVASDFAMCSKGSSDRLGLKDRRVQADSVGKSNVPPNLMSNL